MATLRYRAFWESRKEELVWLKDVKMMSQLEIARHYDVSITTMRKVGRHFSLSWKARPRMTPESRVLRAMNSAAGMTPGQIALASNVPASEVRAVLAKLRSRRAVVAEPGVIRWGGRGRAGTEFTVTDVRELYRKEA